MKKMNRYYILMVLVAILAIKAVISFSEKSEPTFIITTSDDAHKNHEGDHASHSGHKTEKNNDEKSDTPFEVSDRCEQIKTRYQSIADVKKKYAPQVRFHNIHKKIEGNVYRLRFFYKESSESEIPTYLVYEENSNEDDLIVENTAHKEGPLFKRIKKAPGEVIYDAEALLVTGHVKSKKDSELFLHYENDELKDVQGKSEWDQNPAPLDCKF